MCQLAQVTRAGFYCYLQGREPVEECITVRSAIQEMTEERDQLKIQKSYLLTISKQLSPRLRGKANQAGCW